MASSNTVKRLSVAIGDTRFSLSVTPKDTMSDVRSALQKLPGGALLWPEFFISLDQNPMSRQDEESTIAWSVIEKKQSVSVHQSDRRKRTAETNNSKQPAKKPRSKETDNFKTSTAKAIDKPEKSKEMEEDGDMTEEEDEEQAVSTPPEDPHAKHDKVVLDSKTKLRKLRDVLLDPKNLRFCSDARRQEFLDEIDSVLQQSPNQVVFGCLGQTGVGKSSLLNALLGEADILPTSGSRGCTAAVVELGYNQEFRNPTDKTTVYRGQVEFISLKEWVAELDLLLGDCCTDGTDILLAKAPEDGEAKAAWDKINTVYGQKTMEKFGKRARVEVLDHLSKDPKLVELLEGANGKHNTVLIEEGVVDNAQAKLLKKSFTTLTGKFRRETKKWAKNFRVKINDFVYRKGSGNEPQTWPLIRKVVLQGPWDVLSSGAVLVDLPGVRDANAARAKVAETYIQNCHKIWIFAPIKRAVDDKTAKDLLGEQFKRKLLMDGQYGNVSFICTHCDDCETTEVMRDHEDVAKNAVARWESMISLQDRIADYEKDKSELFAEKEEIEEELDELKQELKELKAEMKSVKAAASEDEDNTEQLKELEAELASKKKAASAVKSKITEWEKSKNPSIDKIKEKQKDVQKELKVMAAKVRNEYSTKCLQDDFRAGLEEMFEETEDASTAGETHLKPLPDGCELEVHCVASNDYLKLEGIKSSCDGASNTFSTAEDTQIPSLRLAVHRTTAHLQSSFVTQIVNATADVLERAKLCSTDSEESMSSAGKIQVLFEEELKVLGQLVGEIAESLIQQSETKINESLSPALLAGAAKGNEQAMDTVSAWGDYKNRRSKNDGGRGLPYKTYEASMKRNGVFNSPRAGIIDLNQELCDPMEKEYGTKWQEVIDAAIINKLLPSQKPKVDAICDKICENLKQRFQEAGIPKPYSSQLLKAARQACETRIREKFDLTSKEAARIQREVHRYLVKKTAERMIPGYENALAVARGQGAFSRMKAALESRASAQFQERMFDGILNEFISSIGDLQKVLRQGILEMAPIIRDNLTKVCSHSWQSQGRIDSHVRGDILACKNRLIPVLNEMLESHKVTLDLAGVERTGIEFDVVAVESWEDRNMREMKEAQGKGLFFDLVGLDSEGESESEEISFSRDPLPYRVVPAAVKSEPSNGVARIYL